MYNFFSMGNFLAVGNLTGQTGNETENCNIYTNFRRNKNSSFLGIAHYEGIPQNLIINLMGWVVRKHENFSTIKQYLEIEISHENFEML